MGLSKSFKRRLKENGDREPVCPVVCSLLYSLFDLLLCLPTTMRVMFQKVDLVLKMYWTAEVTRSNDVPLAGELARLMRVG